MSACSVLLIVAILCGLEEDHTNNLNLVISTKHDAGLIHLSFMAVLISLIIQCLERGFIEGKVVYKELALASHHPQVLRQVADCDIMTQLSGNAVRKTGEDGRNNIC